MSRIDTATLPQATEDVLAFGLAVFEQDADQIERPNDATSRLGLVWRGLSNQLAVAAAPALEVVANAMLALANRTGPLGIAIRGGDVLSDLFILRGVPDHIRSDHGFIEAFNSKLGAECLNAHWFMSLADACEKWMHGVETTKRSGPTARSDAACRSPCIIPMVQPAHPRERASKIIFRRSKIGAQNTNPQTPVMNGGPEGARHRKKQRSQGC